MTVADLPGVRRQAASMRLLADHPLWILGGVLVVLIAITGAIRPSYLSFSGLRNTVLLAAPLGIMAAAQTLLMLTGGIDLSVAMVATGAAYVAGNRSPSGALIAIASGLLVGLIAGATNGIGVGIFQVNPLIMTLAMAAILLGLFTSWAQTIFTGSTTVAPLIKTLGGGSFFGNRVPYN
ncbi:MAG: ABC transporter permease, partial [Actinomycetota bacterium]|nr:ABC transporter permease [Actinomycetota bacterium]